MKKKPKIKKFKIKDPLYSCALELWAGGSEQDLCDAVNKLDTGKGRWEPDGRAGCQFSIPTGENKQKHCIWIGEFNWTIRDQAIVGHELLHLVGEALGHDVGMPFNKGSTEAYAYYFEHLMRQIWNALLKYSPRKKK